MTIATIKLDETAQLEFDIQVSGMSDKIESTRFVIEGKDFDIICKTDITPEGSSRVHIPRLKGLFESGIHQARLEVIIDNKVFVPLRETIEFETLVEVKSTRRKFESSSPTIT